MSEALLLACTVATLFMTGVTWFVQVVHYPSFPFVGHDRFGDFHEAHSRRTSIVVVLPMVVELLTSLALVAFPPAGSLGLAIAGALLAVAIWATTAVAASIHGEIGRQGPEPYLFQRLDRASLVRSLLWTAHGAVVIAMLVALLCGTGAN